MVIRSLFYSTAARFFAVIIGDWGLGTLPPFHFFKYKNMGSKYTLFIINIICVLFHRNYYLLDSLKLFSKIAFFTDICKKKCESAPDCFLFSKYLIFEKGRGSRYSMTLCSICGCYNCIFMDIINDTFIFEECFLLMHKNTRW